MGGFVVDDDVIDIVNTAFLLALLTLIVTVYDRYRKAPSRIGTARAS